MQAFPQFHLLTLSDSVISLTVVFLLAALFVLANNTLLRPVVRVMALLEAQAGASQVLWNEQPVD